MDTSWYKGDSYTLLIKKLYQFIDMADDYVEWRNSFIFIHGEFDTQRKIDVESFEKAYNIKLENNQEKIFKLIYCLETYYSITLRIIAHKSIFGSSCFSLEIFDNKTYLSKGITNYTCENYFNWFLHIPNIELDLIRLYKTISIDELSKEGDSISTIFEFIFPKEIRHSIGEYYTPYWLANIIIERVTSSDANAPNKKYLDPACGSGTFLVALINKYRQASNNEIFYNICGIDINPLTVLAARTNFLLLYCKEFISLDNIQLEIPIYCADTIAVNDITHSLFQELNQYDNVPAKKYDYILGNPPWVNWEYMPKSYKINHVQLWQYYGLFSQKGINANFIKEDISVLLTYVAIDNYLAIGGKIGFVIKETLFKSIKQGEGFRKFRISPKKIDLKVIQVDDLTQLKPFKDAVTRTAIIYLEKGAKTEYPVDYYIWQPSTKTKTFENNKKIDLSKHFELKKLKARPSIKNEINSGWITESEEEMNYSNYILGGNDLVARTGVFTGGANGIYWLKIISTKGDNLLVSNITERAKNKMKKVKMEIEKEFVYPFLTGNDLDFWSYNYSKYILCPHTLETRMYPVNRSVLANYPLTEKYFIQFKDELIDRKGFTSMDKPIHDKFYYTLQRIGIYTFSKYKVCWRYISKKFTPAVVEYANDYYLGVKNIIGNEKIISIGIDDMYEAYYVCGVISSTPYRQTIENYMVGTQITPSIIGRINIPKYNKQNKQHLEIANLCLQGHGCNGSKEFFIQKIDNIVKTWLK